MDIVREEFDSEAIQPAPNSIKMYNEETAVKMILRCKEMGYMITGLESYRVEGTSVEPFMEHSIDYMFSKYGSKGIGCWDDAIDFIKSKHQYGLVFDVFYLISDATVRDPFPDIMSVSKDKINDWILRNRKGNVNFIEEYSEIVETGKVIRYKINGGSIGDKVKRNTPIEIVISKGKVPPS